MSGLLSDDNISLADMPQRTKPQKRIGSSRENSGQNSHPSYLDDSSCDDSTVSRMYLHDISFHSVSDAIGSSLLREASSIQNVNSQVNSRQIFQSPEARRMAVGGVVSPPQDQFTTDSSDSRLLQPRFPLIRGASPGGPSLDSSVSPISQPRGEPSTSSSPSSSSDTPSLDRWKRELHRLLERLSFFNPRDGCLSVQYSLCKLIGSARQLPVPDQSQRLLLALHSFISTLQDESSKLSRVLRENEELRQQIQQPPPVAGPQQTIQRLQKENALIRAERDGLFQEAIDHFQQCLFKEAPSTSPSEDSFGTQAFFLRVLELVSSDAPPCASSSPSHDHASMSIALDRRLEVVRNALQERDAVTSRLQRDLSDRIRFLEDQLTQQSPKAVLESVPLPYLPTEVNGLRDDLVCLSKANNRQTGMIRDLKSQILRLHSSLSLSHSLSLSSVETTETYNLAIDRPVPENRRRSHSTSSLRPHQSPETLGASREGDQPDLAASFAASASMIGADSSSPHRTHPSWSPSNVPSDPQLQVRALEQHLRDIRASFRLFEETGLASHLDTLRSLFKTELWPSPGASASPLVSFPFSAAESVIPFGDRPRLGDISLNLSGDSLPGRSIVGRLSIPSELTSIEVFHSNTTTSSSSSSLDILSGGRPHESERALQDNDESESHLERTYQTLSRRLSEKDIEISRLREEAERDHIRSEDSLSVVATLEDKLKQERSEKDSLEELIVHQESMIRTYEADLAAVRCQLCQKDDILVSIDSSLLSTSQDLQSSQDRMEILQSACDSSAAEYQRKLDQLSAELSSHRARNEAIVLQMEEYERDLDATRSLLDRTQVELAQGRDLLAARDSELGDLEESMDRLQAILVQKNLVIEHLSECVLLEHEARALHESRASELEVSSESYRRALEVSASRAEAASECLRQLDEEASFLAIAFSYLSEDQAVLRAERSALETEMSALRESCDRDASESRLRLEESAAALDESQRSLHEQREEAVSLRDQLTAERAESAGVRREASILTEELSEQLLLGQEERQNLLRAVGSLESDLLVAALGSRRELAEVRAASKREISQREDSLRFLCESLLLIRVEEPQGAPPQGKGISVLEFPAPGFAVSPPVLPSSDIPEAPSLFEDDFSDVSLPSMFLENAAGSGATPCPVAATSPTPDARSEFAECLLCLRLAHESLLREHSVLSTLLSQQDSELEALRAERSCWSFECSRSELELRAAVEQQKDRSLAIDRLKEENSKLFLQSASLLEERDSFASRLASCEASLADTSLALVLLETGTMAELRLLIGPEPCASSSAEGLTHLEMLLRSRESEIDRLEEVSRGLRSDANEVADACSRRLQAQQRQSQEDSETFLVLVDYLRRTTEAFSARWRVEEDAWASLALQNCEVVLYVSNALSASESSKDFLASETTRLRSDLASADDRISRLEGELALLSEEKAQLLCEVDSVRSSLGFARGDLEERHRSLSSLQSENSALLSSVLLLKEENAKIRSDAAVLSLQLDRRSKDTADLQSEFNILSDEHRTMRDSLLLVSLSQSVLEQRSEDDRTAAAHHRSEQESAHQMEREDLHGRMRRLEERIQEREAALHQMSTDHECALERSASEFQTMRFLVSSLEHEKEALSQRLASVEQESEEARAHLQDALQSLLGSSQEVSVSHERLLNDSRQSSRCLESSSSSSASPGGFFLTDFLDPICDSYRRLESKGVESECKLNQTMEELDRSNKRLAEFKRSSKSKIERAKSMLLRLQSDNRTLQSRLQELESQSADHFRIRDREVSELRTREQSLVASVQEFAERESELSRSLAQQTAEADRLRSSLERVESEIAAHRCSLVDRESRLRKLEGRLESMQLLETRHSDLVTESKGLRARLEAATGICEEREHRIQTLERDLQASQENLNQECRSIPSDPNRFPESESLDASLRDQRARGDETAKVLKQREKEARDLREQSEKNDEMIRILKRKYSEIQRELDEIRSQFEQKKCEVKKERDRWKEKLEGYRSSLESKSKAQSLLERENQDLRSKAAIQDSALSDLRAVVKAQQESDRTRGEPTTCDLRQELQRLSDRLSSAEQASERDREQAESVRTESSELQRRVKTLASELESLREENRALSQKLGQRESQLRVAEEESASQASAILNDSRRQISDLEEENRGLLERLRACESKIATLRARRQVYRGDIAQLKEQGNLMSTIILTLEKSLESTDQRVSFSREHFQSFVQQAKRTQQNLASLLDAYDRLQTEKSSLQHHLNESTVRARELDGRYRSLSSRARSLFARMAEARRCVRKLRDRAGTSVAAVDLAPLESSLLSFQSSPSSITAEFDDFSETTSVSL